jgi:hypothetical protein
MKCCITGFYLLLSLLTFGQVQDTLQKNVIDSLYREDQIYIGLTYNIMDNRPIDLKQNFFSPGINFGFLRDFPINKKRTVAIAPGFGLSYSGYNQNLLIQKTNNEINYSVVSSTEFNRNNLSFYAIDFPIEFRWRNSTPDNFKFLRIYSGFKYSYIFYDTSILRVDGDVSKVANNPDVVTSQMGVYLSIGYHSVNFYTYYGLTNLFKSNAAIDGTPLELSTINLGFQFYIL